MSSCCWRGYNRNHWPSRCQCTGDNDDDDDNDESSKKPVKVPSQQATKVARVRALDSFCYIPLFLLVLILADGVVVSGRGCSADDHTAGHAAIRFGALYVARSACVGFQSALQKYTSKFTTTTNYAHRQIALNTPQVQVPLINILSPQQRGKREEEEEDENDDQFILAADRSTHFKGSQVRFASLLGTPLETTSSSSSGHRRRARRFADSFKAATQHFDTDLPCGGVGKASASNAQGGNNTAKATTLSTKVKGGGSKPGTGKNNKSGVTTTTTKSGKRPLLFWETMIAGAISRSVAQTVMHPANTMKTILQNSQGPVLPTILGLLKPSSFHRLTYGAGTNFLLSVPNGALNFSVLEFVRKQLGYFVASHPYLAENADKLSSGLDFLSSSISTVVCSVVATPQMMITDNIMAGNYPNLFSATKGLAKKGGIRAFYRGWLPGMLGKIPSYALTWTLFQRFKVIRDSLSDRPATNVENSIMGVVASATTVCFMIPLDTIKTRLVVQGGAASINAIPYKGIMDCAVRIVREEGVGAFYRGLPPRLVSVVPMIGIQFAVYEFMKNVLVQRPIANGKKMEKLEEMEHAAESKISPVPPPPPDLFEDVEEVALPKPPRSLLLSSPKGEFASMKQTRESPSLLNNL